MNMMSLVRVHNSSISLDGFGTGEGQSRDAHFGHAGGCTNGCLRPDGGPARGPAGAAAFDDAFARPFEPGIDHGRGTTFHFIDASPARTLEAAREAAAGQDVRLGGGATVIREFLAAGLVDYMHVVVVPILLGRGVRLWDGLEGIERTTRSKRPHRRAGSRM
jgi:hypothetical protein